MNLRYITCSDPREHVAPDQIMNLLRDNPRAEIAVQAHPSKMSFGMPRHDWFDGIVRDARNAGFAPNLAVHVNLDWANMFARGIIPAELVDWFYVRRPDGAPVIHRWQINIHGSQTPLFQSHNVASLLTHNPDHEFIFQYGPSERARMNRLHATGARFSVLYDTSGGRGITSRRIRPPLFEMHPQGYSGGMSPENITENLDKIARVAPARDDIWVDAEGKLKSPESKKFDINLARAYVDAAMAWQRAHTK